MQVDLDYEAQRKSILDDSPAMKGYEEAKTMKGVKWKTRGWWSATHLARGKTRAICGKEIPGYGEIKIVNEHMATCKACLTKYEPRRHMGLTPTQELVAELMKDGEVHDYAEIYDAIHGDGAAEKAGMEVANNYGRQIIFQLRGQLEIETVHGKGYRFKNRS